MHSYPPKILSRIISAESSIVDALRQMDSIGAKLLLVMDGDIFKGLITIGDIQRAILKEVSLNDEILTILRKDITVATAKDTPEQIRNNMIVGRDECMPILDEQNRLVELILWEELFANERRTQTQKIELPVVIMAGGKGTRLKPLTNIIPKPMVPLGEKSILETIIQNFTSYQIKDFYITTNFKHGLLLEHLRETGLIELVQVVKEERQMGTVGCLSLFRSSLPNGCILTNCDILIEEDYNDFIDFHYKNKNDITIIAAIKSFDIKYGLLNIGENGKLISIHEKPRYNHFINTGMYILSSNALELIPEESSMDLTELIESAQSNGLSVKVFPISESDWIDIGEWEGYQSYFFQSGYTQRPFLK